MRPIYERTDYCSDPKTLWGKLKSGKWDWLGVDPKGDFVLGYPKRKGVMSGKVMIEVHRQDAVKGEHSVRIYDDPASDEPDRHDSLPDAVAAASEFRRVVEDVRTSGSYRLSRVQRIEEGRIVEEWFGVVGHSDSWYPERL